VDRSPGTVAAVSRLAAALGEQHGVEVSAGRLLPLLCPLLVAPSLGPSDVRELAGVVQVGCALRVCVCVCVLWWWGGGGMYQTGRHEAPSNAIVLRLLLPGAHDEAGAQLTDECCRRCELKVCFFPAGFSAE
jgi:hypothetical protein